MSSSTPSEADRLKAEGNTLFSKNNFKGAYKKYTEALKHDGENRILYSNRAACSLGLNRYLDASVDATKATELDPRYAKAWGRLAAARMGLGRVDQAIEAWTRALEVLPAENLAPAEKKQKDQYSSELATAKAKFDDLQANPKQWEGLKIYHPGERWRLPWERAIAMLPDLAASQTWNSSAWVIERAFRSWERGINGMKEGHIQNTQGGPIYVSRRGVLEEFSNALIEDSRISHMADENFVSTYNKQMAFEIAITKAWSGSGPKAVMQEAPKRLKAEGWESVRPALAVTVRGWIIRAFFEGNLSDDIGTAIDLYTSAVEVLDWGAERWKGVPFEMKGATFQPTFLRGVKCLRLDALMKACKQNLSKCSYEELLASADGLLSELEDAPPRPDTTDIPFFLTFFRYPMAQAHSVRGFYLLHKAKLSRQANGGGLTPDVTRQYMEASFEYIKAANSYPPDDENRAWFLHCAYHVQLDGGTTPRFLLDILDQLEESIPMMKKIWKFTPQAVTRQKLFEGDMGERDNLKRSLAASPVGVHPFVSSAEPGKFI